MMDAKFYLLNKSNMKHLFYEEIEVGTYKEKHLKTNHPYIKRIYQYGSASIDKDKDDMIDNVVVELNNGYSEIFSVQNASISDWELLLNTVDDFIDTLKKD